MKASKTFLHKVLEDARIEAKVTDSFTNGEISGYAALWDITDLDGDIIRKGAFKRSIDNQINAKQVPFMIKHFRRGGDVLEMIGTIVEAREDDIGFWIRAELDGSEISNQVRQKVATNSKPFGMSIGWLDYPDGYKPMPEGGIEYKSLNLKEVTLTLLPSQQATIGFVQGKDAQDFLDTVMDRMDKIEEQLCALQSKESDREPAEDTAELEEETETTEAKTQETSEELARIRANLEIARKERERELELLGV